MGPIGMPEMLVILVIALVVFGPRKLPELGRSLGRSLNEFKKASHELRSTLDDEIRLEEQKEQRAKLEAEQKAAVSAAEVPTSTAETESAAGDTPAAPDEPTVSRSSTSA
jgi:sec-independent protein translocase protein TatA